jgi:plastocyanin
MLLFVFVLFSDLSSTNFVEAQNHPQVTNATILLDSTNLSDKAYQPNPIEIPVWGSVSWTNDDRIAHFVTATEGDLGGLQRWPEPVPPLNALPVQLIRAPDRHD